MLHISENSWAVYEESWEVRHFTCDEQGRPEDTEFGLTVGKLVDWDSK
jgi:hypothetical protein